jgi:hypothetical protein
MVPAIFFPFALNKDEILSAGQPSFDTEAINHHIENGRAEKQKNSSWTVCLD